jgi:flagellar M-ring protein FliF
VDTSSLMERVKGISANFTATQMVTLGVTFVLVVGVIGGSAMWLNTPTFALLLSDMDPDTASQVIARMKTLKVAYTVDAGGRAIRVPSDKVDELRLELTSQGMPASGRIGFEIFDRTAFGATEFLEHVNYRRALEGEIGRTVATLAEVSSARVHITIGKDSLFGEARPAKASVVLKLRGRTPMSTASISGIANLVAASVEGLRPEAVVILDNFGRPLARPQADDTDPLGAGHLERQQRLERDIATRVVALIEPVVGEDRVRVNVTLKLDPSSSDETEERWDPATAVIRSKQTTSDVASTAAIPLLVAGARGNLPPGPADKPAVPAGPGVVANLPGTSRQAETTNYEVSRVTRHVVQPRGDITRLSVAVILDDAHTMATDKDGQSKLTRVARTREELTKIQGLVAAAVGLDAERGDQLTIENVSFDEPVVPDAVPQTTMQRFAPQIDQVTRIGTVLVLALVALLFVIRPALRRVGMLPDKGRTLTGAIGEAPLAALGPKAVRTVAELESEIEAELDAAAQEKSAGGRKMPVLTRKVAAITKTDPEQVARALRSWITDEAR